MAPWLVAPDVWRQRLKGKQGCRRLYLCDDETFHEFFVALKSSGFEGPFWVCAMAIYQNEDVEQVTIAKQLGPDALYGPFATVLRQADCMVAVITAQCDIYTRMWCVFEMAIAIDLTLDVHVAQFTEAVISAADPRAETTRQKTSHGERPFTAARSC